jgi:hypothetical protein
MRKAGMRLIAYAIPLACAGCVSTNAAVLDNSVSYQKICPDGVQIFTSAERVPGPYTEVALLNSKGESSWTSEQGMAHSQRKKAAELGANGLIIGDTKEPNAGTKIIGSILGTGAERKGKAVAIFIPSDSLRVQRVCKITPRTTQASVAEPAPAQPPARNVATPESGPAVATEVTPASTSPQSPSVAASTPSIPPGINFVGDHRRFLYFPATCAVVRDVPAEERYYYRTEAAAQAEGYVLSEKGC